MTEKNPPLFLTTQQHDAEYMRRWVASGVFDQAGVLDPGTDLAVTKGSGLVLQIAAGRAYVPGTESVGQGSYYIENVGTDTVTMTAGNASLPRKDRVVARVRDSGYSGLPGDDGWTLEVVVGTPASTPAEPTLPANSLELAMVDVPANAGSVDTMTVTDRRAALIRPGVQAFANDAERATRLPDPQLGTISYTIAEGRHEWWNGAGWVAVVPTITVSTATPSGGTDGDIWIRTAS